MIKYPFSYNLNNPLKLKRFFDYNFGLKIASKLPDKLGFEIATIRGMQYYRKNVLIKNEIEKGLMKYFEVEKSKSIAKLNFIYQSIEEFFAVKIAKRDKSFIINHCFIENEEFIKNEKRGIFILIHEGHFIPGLCFIAERFNLVMNSVAWPYFDADSKILRNFLKAKIEGMRSFTRGKFFYVGHINPKELYECLDREEFLTIAVDSPLGKSAKLDVNFLGKRKYPYTAFKLAYKKGLPIFPLFFKFNFNDKIINIEILEPFLIQRKDDIPLKMQKFFIDMEKRILNYPEEYFYYTSPSSWRCV